MKTKLLKLVNQAFLRIESWENENKIVKDNKLFFSKKD